MTKKIKNEKENSDEQNLSIKTWLDFFLQIAAIDYKKNILIEKKHIKVCKTYYFTFATY